MTVKEELQEAWEDACRRQMNLASEAPSLDQQIELLEGEVDELTAHKSGLEDPRRRVRLMASLCLLSELCSAVNFDRMIEARERFQDILPEHFSFYLSHLESMTWHVSWSGCLECRHFAGKCTLNVAPVESEDTTHHLAKSCCHKKRRSRNL